MKKITILVLILLSVQLAFSQAGKKTDPVTTQLIESPKEDPAVKEILANLKTARENNNMTAKEYWEKKLHEITKPQILKDEVDYFVYEKISNAGANPSVLNLTTLIGGEISSNAISRDRISGYIYAAVVINGFGIKTDTLRVFRSTNNGLSFSMIGGLTASSGLFSIYSNSLDVEAVNKGDSSFAFISYSYQTATSYSSTILRVREDGQQKVANFIGTASNKIIKMRITSDNARHTAATYIYAMATMDSTAVGVRKLKTKLYILETPFSNPFNSTIPITVGYQNPAGGYYSYNTLTSPDSAKMESDIAYVNTALNGDYLCTVTVVRGIPSVFNDGKSLYFSKGTGYTAPTLFSVADTKYLESPRIAATGNLNNSTVVVSRRLYGGIDWDAYSHHTTNMDAALPSFLEDYIEPPPGTDITLGVSVAASYRSNGSYMFAYSTLVAPTKANIYTRPYYNMTLGAVVKSNPDNAFGSYIYSYPDAGFRNVNNDSCLVIWGGNASTGSTVTGGCSGAFIGINHSSSTVEGYYLLQNYPNPFNPATSISFELPGKDFVTLKVYDVLGNEVMELVNERQEAGLHTVQFDAKNLPSGTYFYKLQTDKFSDVKKMILIK